MRVTVHVSPGSARTAVGGRYGDGDPPVLAVRVTARAVDGQANAAVVAALAEAFAVRPGAVEIVRGHRGRTKLVEITGADPASLASLLTGGGPQK